MMKKLVIKEVYLHNFKGFGEIRIPLNGKDVVILGGKNGYGKTTLFDALELLLTGKIQRMANYNEYHNNRYSISQGEKPLVFDKSFSDVVLVSAVFEYEERTFTLLRKADVASMKNPVDFAAFGNLKMDDGNGAEHELSDKEQRKLGIYDFCQSYSFLNYLSQEEATTFLKRKEADRAEMLSQLFDLSMYETYIDRIKKVQKALNAQRSSWTEKKRSIENSIRRLHSSGEEMEQRDIRYIQITNNPGHFQWDNTNPKLSHEEFSALLEENGILDRLAYLARNFDEYKKDRRNHFLNQHGSDNEIHKLALYAKYNSRKTDINLYLEFNEKVVHPVASLMLDSINRFALDIPEALRKYIADEVFENLNNRIKILQDGYKSFDNIQRAQSAILEMRNKLAVAIERSPENYQKCPVCGHDYASQDQLLKSIEKHSEELRMQTQDSLAEMQKMFDGLRKELRILIVETLIDYFTEIGITDKVCEDYKNINEGELQKTLGVLFDKFEISIDTTCSIEAIADSIKRQMQSAIKECDSTLEYQLMHQAYLSYGKYVQDGLLTGIIIQKKRMYLADIWNKVKSEQLKGFEREKQIAETTLDNINRRSKEFKSLLKDVQDSEKSYLSKLLSDIKILFYIYSGRIMQDNYFGRGLFIKEDLDRKRVLITSSKGEQDEVDALFNMSSGQLVSLVVALTLSLNKLYSSIPFIAIDDPIQTMDDINLWGLIETLRHDFNDHYMLLSTHETDYGKLLEYKLRKWGIDTEYLEMSQLHRM